MNGQMCVQNTEHEMGHTLTLFLQFKQYLDKVIYYKFQHLNKN